MSFRPLTRLLATTLLSSVVLVGCGQSPGGVFALVALVHPFMKPTGNICIDSPAEAYADGVSTCPRSPSPLGPSNVNSPYASSNGYCALEWALVDDRVEIVREALALGADPFKCHVSGAPFFTALRHLQGRHGPERLRFYLDLFKGTKAFDREAGARFVRYGIQSLSPEYIGYGLEAGHPVDGRLNMNYPNGRFKDIYAGKSPIYVASVRFLIEPLPALAPPIEFLVQRGARADPEIDDFIAEHRSGLNPATIEQLQQLLRPQPRQPSG